MRTIVGTIALLWCTFGAGVLISGSFFAFLCLIGVLPRLASLTKTQENMYMYENFLGLGILFFHLVYFADRPWFHLGYAVMHYTVIPLLLLFFGFFTGCLAGALAESLNTLPIFERRFHLKEGIRWFVYAWGFGKLAGSLIGTIVRIS